MLRDARDAPELVTTNDLALEGRVYGVAFDVGALLLRKGTRLHCLRAE